MSYGGAGMDVGMTGMAGTTEAVPEAGSGAMPSGGMKMPAMGGGRGGSKGSAHSLPSQRPIGEHPETPENELDNAPTRQGFARLSEIPGRQRTYGTP